MSLRDFDDFKQALSTAEEGQLAVDVLENATEVIVRAVIAGVKPDDIDIHVTPDLVTIRGERKAHNTSEDTVAHYEEVFWGAFSRSIILPVHVQPSQAHAAFSHGVLTLTIPKVHGEMRVKIDQTYDN